MCGRYSFETEIDALITAYKLQNQEIRYEPKPEIRPTNQAPILLADGNLKPLKWGFTPSFAKSPLINARGETVFEKRTFKEAFQRRRCIVPTTGFYEWGLVEGREKKQKYLFQTESPILSMAGIWEIFPNNEGEDTPCFCILTTASTDQMQGTHDRMPVILAEDEIRKYLNHANFTIDDFQELLLQKRTRLSREERA